MRIIRLSEPEGQLLLSPGERQLAGDFGDGHVGWSAAVSDRLDDARRQVGKGRQESDVTFGEMFTLCDRREVNRWITNDALAQFRQRAIEVRSDVRVASSITPMLVGACVMPLRGRAGGVNGIDTFNSVTPASAS